METTLATATDIQQTELPALGRSIPRRGNRLTRTLFTLSLIHI